jgi:hypothetical protein
MAVTASLAAIAIHEAIHAVAALAEGFDLLEVSIVPGKGDQLGVTVVAPPAGWVPVGDDWCPGNQDDSEQHAAIAPWLRQGLAPCAGQFVFGADLHLEDDIAQAWALVARLEFDEHQARVYVQQRLSEARQLVVEHQTSIEWVAGALLKKGTLTGGEVRAIVAAAKRSA